MRVNPFWLVWLVWLLAWCLLVFSLLCFGFGFCVWVLLTCCALICGLFCLYLYLLLGFIRLFTLVDVMLFCCLNLLVIVVLRWRFTGVLYLGRLIVVGLVYLWLVICLWCCLLDCFVWVMLVIVYMFSLLIWLLFVVVGCLFVMLWLWILLPCCLLSVV